MKRCLLFETILALSMLTLSACCQPTSDDTGLANPAAVYCEEQGYTVELRTGADGGAYGVCIFPDGTECEEWAFYRGECAPGERIVELTDVPTNTPLPEMRVNLVTLARLADTVEIEILESAMAEVGGYVHRLTISDAGVIAQIVAALDVDLKLSPPARCPASYLLRFHLADGSVQEFGYGCGAENPMFLRGGQDFWQGQDAVPPAQFNALIQQQLAASPKQIAVVGWYGWITSLPEGSQYDDYLSLVPEGGGEFGVAGAVEAQIVALCDQEGPGRYAHFWGTLACGVVDYNDCRLVVTSVRVGTEVTGPEPIEGWEGLVISNPPMAEYDDHFVLSGKYLMMYGIGSSDPAVAAQLEQLRDTLMPVRVWGELTCGVPDTNGCHIEVDRIELGGEH